jgi:heme/copper-type cytochrome/quinol oxidase subunit 2
MYYLQAPANAGIIQLMFFMFFGVIALLIYFIFGRQKSTNAKKIISASATKEIKNLTIEGISEKTSSCGYQLQIAGKDLMYTLYVLIILVFLNFFVFIKMSDQTVVKELSTVKAHLDILVAINAFGGIIILMLQYSAFTAIKKSGDHLVS